MALPMGRKRRRLVGTLVGGSLLVLALGAEAAPPKTLTGTWLFERDKGGMTPAADAKVRLVFGAAGSVRLHAERGTAEVTDRGSYKYAGGRLTMNLPETEIAVKGKKVASDGPFITLPFLLFSDATGQSVWRRAERVSLAAFASGVMPTEPTGAGAPGAVGLAARLAKARTTATAPPGAAASVFTAPPAPPVPPPARAGSGPFAHLAGRWVGRAIGAETRYRKVGSLALYAKHVADFWFDVDATGLINGMVAIRYSVDVDHAGTGPEARAVAGFVEAWHRGGGTADAAMVRYESGLPMKIVSRTVPIKGYVDPARNELVVATIGDLGSLDYTYLASGLKKVSPFPAWTPFLEAAGAKIRVEGSTYAGRSAVSGTDRRKPWKEYWFTWSATLRR